MDNVKDHGIYGFADQPAINVDGRLYKYVAASATGGATGAGKYRGGGNIALYDNTGEVRAMQAPNGLTYVPEDSSGGLHANGHVVQADVPGSGGHGEPASLNGAAGHAEIAPERPDQGAVV